MATVTLSVYPSERLKKTDLKDLFHTIEMNALTFLTSLGFEHPIVEVNNTGLLTSGSDSQVLVTGLSGLTPALLQKLFGSIKAAFKEAPLPDSEYSEVVITFEGKTVSD